LEAASPQAGIPNGVVFPFVKCTGQSRLRGLRNRSGPLPVATGVLRSDSGRTRQTDRRLYNNNGDMT